MWICGIYKGSQYSSSVYLCLGGLPWNFKEPAWPYAALQQDELQTRWLCWPYSALVEIQVQQWGWMMLDNIQRRHLLWQEGKSQGWETFARLIRMWCEWKRKQERFAFSLHFLSQNVVIENNKECGWVKTRSCSSMMILYDSCNTWAWRHRLCSKGSKKIAFPLLSFITWKQTLPIPCAGGDGLTADPYPFQRGFSSSSLVGRLLRQGQCQTCLFWDN